MVVAVLAGNDKQCCVTGRGIRSENANMWVVLEGSYTKNVFCHLIIWDNGTHF